ncbi:hypothetical protein CBP36_13970 [Acidovorax carolinensis]|uniref:Uncharacterized protein n=2 Tax=Acidovorax carolinensis TaxID=553814 RepID=A0A240UE81_9BURK|nr:hypothetical protein CBP35_04960 [Acidovorax carolinensis]ART59788.1 hypothetical protein CBP36_13970 [Acidovorax carolinensis]
MHITHCPQAPSRTWGTTILCTCMALSLLVISNTAQAARKSKSTETVASPAAKKKGSVKVKHQRSPSEESTAERDRRLYRECKGLPNAGACLGYTRR